MRLNVINDYSYTLETIIQARRNRMGMMSVPIRTNAETRPSRLFSSMGRYIKRSSSVIIRSALMYRPLSFFCTIGGILFSIGIFLGLRYLFFLIAQGSSGHIQSLILCAVLLLSGFQTMLLGLQADVMAANRKLIEDVQYRVRRIESDGMRSAASDGENGSKHETR